MTKETLKAILINAIDNGIDQQDLDKITNLGEFKWVNDGPISFKCYARNFPTFEEAKNRIVEKELFDITTNRMIW